jgi:pyrroline-5-carboxylate reductase
VRRVRARKAAIVLIGAGRMGGALLKGWISSKLGPIVVVEPNPSAALRRFARVNAVALHAQIEDVDATGTAACVIAIKPQILKNEAARLRAIAESGALLVSIAAGTSIKTLANACGRKARIIRAMPNLPGAIGQGISALYAPARTPAKDRAMAESLLAALGDTLWVSRETLIDAVTTVSGSGPAYVFLLVEVLAQAAQAEGLPRLQAEKLARATIVGAGALLDAETRSAAELRRDVTSPAGTTEAALRVLMGDDVLARLMARAVAAARARAAELSG